MRPALAHVTFLFLPAPALAASVDVVMPGLRKGTTLHFLPVMNPDGAARFQRRNAQGIDVNRDARALASPEARALHALRED